MRKPSRHVGIEVQRLFRQKKHGMEVVALELIRELQKIDVDNRYTVFVKEDVDDGCLQSTSNFSICKLKASAYPIWEQAVLPKAIVKHDLDVFHATCNTAPLAVNTPVVLTLHDIIYLENINFNGTYYQNFGNLYRRMIVPLAVKRSKAVITVSEFEKAEIVNRLKVHPDKVQVIYNAVSSRFRPDIPREEIDAFREKYRLPRNYILFLGNTAPKKNTRNTILAFVEYAQRNPGGASLVVLDYERSAVMEELKRLGQESSIDRFYFPGYIPLDSMPVIYAAASLYLYPSLRESFGLPLLEAMASGVPVITSNVSSMPEIGGEAAKLIDPHNPSQIAGSIEMVLADGILAREMIDAGLARAAAFSWKNAAEKLLSVYEQF